MKKPTTRKERIQFIMNKKGRHYLAGFEFLTDREVKQLFDSMYVRLKVLPDYNETAIEVPTCIRCGQEVDHILECGCGINKAVFTKEDWKTDIEEGVVTEHTINDTLFQQSGYTTIPTIEEIENYTSK